MLRAEEVATTARRENAATVTATANANAAFVACHCFHQKRIGQIPRRERLLLLLLLLTLLLTLVIRTHAYVESSCTAAHPPGTTTRTAPRAMTVSGAELVASRAAARVRSTGRGKSRLSERRVESAGSHRRCSRCCKMDEGRERERAPRASEERETRGKVEDISTREDDGSWIPTSCRVV